MRKMKIEAVLSTTVLPIDGTYHVSTLKEIPDVKGVPHFVGHPDTKVIVESLGAIQADSKLFGGLNHGESAVCFSIKQGRSTRKTEGFTTPHQEVSAEDLDCRVITRARICPFCGEEGMFYACSNCGAV